MITMIFVSACTKINKGSIPPEKYCEKDTDCVPNKCCHAEDVVNIKYAPNCNGVGCTKDCRTILDCRFGTPICRYNQCTIKRLK
ncbi:hypothetical protein HYX02_00430 [Candidatus Woesearchaeota archaeon]|nr:hypothetical protein [Candidatus Woesearchaeota archaeon]